MNVGVQDAFNLGWKLAFVVKGLASRKILESYEKERKPVASQVIEGTDAMHDIIMAHGKGMQDRLEATQAAGWHEAAVSRISGLSYHYRNTAKLPKARCLPGDLQPGDRAPDRNITGHGRLFDMLKHSYMTLLLIATSDSAASHIAHVREVIETSFSKIVKLYVIDTEEEDEFLQMYGRFDCGHLYLLRPDGVIYVHCKLDDIDEFDKFMNDCFPSNA